MQGYEATGKDLYEIVEFCESLETVKEIYKNQGKSTNHNKKLSSTVLDTNKIIWIVQG